MAERRIVRVALKKPLPTYFDYLGPPQAVPGVRVRVPFGRRREIGIVVETDTDSALASDRLREVIEVIDHEPLLDAGLLALLRWAARYYCHAPGEVIAAALPRPLRAGRPLHATETVWKLTPAGADVDWGSWRRRAPRQAAALERLSNSVSGLDTEALDRLGPGWRAVLARLETRGWVARRERRTVASPGAGTGEPAGFELTADQRQALGSLRANSGRFHVHLLDGVTGSGKTEVYLRLISEVAECGRQTLVLVPEIGLTPQFVERFRRRLSTPFVVLHSGLSDSQRLAAWRAAHDGSASVIVGTRSAVFAPLPRPGLIVVDEEHDTSYKQQEGFRYSARDLAVVRAQHLDVPVVLGSATPSLESLYNVARDRYTALALRARPGDSEMPAMRLIDMRREPSDAGLSLSLRTVMRRHLDAGNQVLLFLNRRGFAPAWFCPDCAWIAQCPRCDARMTYHRAASILRCHHCGAQRAAEPACPQCASELVAVGIGTERVEQRIAELFGDVSTVRIDRDTTRRRGALEHLIGAIRAGRHQILIGTQMLTKGHHFPDVTLVGIVDADQGLFGTDPRSNERLAQLIVQVAGRAGRADRPGEVLIQTHCPDHVLLNTLLREGYARFAQAALREREDAGWPPFSALALLRAEAGEECIAQGFLCAARELMPAPAPLRMLGPAPAPMLRRAGRFRVQLLVQGPRAELQRFLHEWTPQLDSLPDARRTRWSVDVDPIDLY